MKKIIIALDSFKGCLSSQEANKAVIDGLSAYNPSLNLQSYTMSDGGEGFTEAMCPDSIIHCHVHDALMRWTDAEFGIKDGKAIIEVAQAVGLSKIEKEQRNPLVATSYGVGELIVQAMMKGCREFIIGLGGSATSDCGLGMLRCLRHAFQTQDHKNWYDSFDTKQWHKLKVTLATDVSNPLCGPNGASYVFAPQKGASSEDVDKLERRALTFSRMAAIHQGFDMSNAAGAGAAGGLGYAFMEFMDAEVVSGATMVLQQNGLYEAMKEAQLIITGEGKADRQTLMGKMPYVMMQRAKQFDVPVVLMAGLIQDKSALESTGFVQAININDGLSMDHALDKEVATQRLKDSSLTLAKHLKL